MLKLNNKIYMVSRVCISGYFDPLHIGHLEFIKLARRLADGELIFDTGTEADSNNIQQLNSDSLSVTFMPLSLSERCLNTKSIKSPTKRSRSHEELSMGRHGELVAIVNNDRQTLLKKGRILLSEQERLSLLNSLGYIDKIILSIDDDKTVCKTLEQLDPKPDFFVNGGDQSNSAIPEKAVCDKLNIKLIDGLGEKKNATDWLNRLEKTRKANGTHRREISVYG